MKLKRQTTATYEKDEHPKHYCLSMGLPSDKLICLESPKKWLKALASELKESSVILENCPTCGALRFDIGFDGGEREYFFTCWKVTENGKEIAKTDHKKFSEYCKSLEQV